jgi:hypothetical protein
MNRRLYVFNDDLDNIHCLHKSGKHEWKNECQVRKVQKDGNEKQSGRNKKYQPVQSGILSMSLHDVGFTENNSANILSKSEHQNPDHILIA